MEKISTKAHWQKYWQLPDHQPLVRHEEMLANMFAVTPVKGKKILEIGVGMGGDSVFLATKGARVTAVDFTKEALNILEENARKAGVHIDLIRADARSLPMKDDTFDVVFHQGFLEHFTRPLELILEQKRVLKPGGILVVDVPQRYTTYTVKKHMLMMLGKWFAGWEREFSVAELERLLKRAGLVPLRSYGWGYYGKLFQMRNANFGSWYTRLWEWIESGRAKLYLNWCIGVISQKPKS